MAGWEQIGEKMATDLVRMEGSWNPSQGSQRQVVVISSKLRTVPLYPHMDNSIIYANRR